MEPGYSACFNGESSNMYIYVLSMKKAVLVICEDSGNENWKPQKIFHLVQEDVERT